MRTEDDLRAALQSLERHAPHLAAVLPPAVRRTGRRRLPRWPWLRVSGPVLVALAVVAAVVAPLAIGKILKTTMPNESVVPATSDSARTFLEGAAARLAATAGPDAGAYWRVTAFDGYLRTYGPNAHPYAIETRTELSTGWYPRSSNAKVAAYVSNGAISVLPTPGAAAAWRADGSPPLPQSAGRVVTQDPNLPGGAIEESYFGNEKLTGAQYQALPASTKGLKDAIIAAVKGQPPPAKPQSNAQAGEIFSVCIALLDRDPVTPAVRAATLRVLATLPGIQLTGQVTDGLGRTGYGITMPGAIISGGFAMGTLDPAPLFRLVISGSGTLLAEEYVASRIVTSIPTATPMRDIPASGAMPGPMTCPAGYFEYAAGECALRGDRVSGDKAHGYTITRPKGGRASGPEPIFIRQPIIVVPAGAVLGYRAFLGAGWTNDLPSTAASTQSIPGS